jgi:hypothetical protein
MVSFDNGHARLVTRTRARSFGALAAKLQDISKMAREAWSDFDRHLQIVRHTPSILERDYWL